MSTNRFGIPSIGDRERIQRSRRSSGIFFSSERRNLRIGRGYGFEKFQLHSGLIRLVRKYDDGFGLGSGFRSQFRSWRFQKEKNLRRQNFVAHPSKRRARIESPLRGIVPKRNWKKISSKQKLACWKRKTAN